MTGPEYAIPDLIRGAKAIAEYVWGEGTPASKVHDLKRRYRVPHRFPIYTLGGETVARRCEIAEWFETKRREQTEAIGRTANDNGDGELANDR